MNKRPNPGSKEAEQQGCLCPVLDNEYGQGYMLIDGMFVIVKGCPLHDPTILKAGSESTREPRGIELP